MSFLDRLFRRKKHVWYRGPDSFKWRVRAAFEQASKDLANLHPEHRLKAIDWKKYSVELKVEPTIRVVRGHPHIKSSVGGLGHVQAQSVLGGNKITIWVPFGVTEATLIYEAGRMILIANGINALAPGQSWSPQNDRHWNLFPKFFKEKYRTPGY
jgi:hypothetical protein